MKGAGAMILKELVGRLAKGSLTSSYGLAYPSYRHNAPGSPPLLENCIWVLDSDSRIFQNPKCPLYGIGRYSGKIRNICKKNYKI